MNNTEKLSLAIKEMIWDDQPVYQLEKLTHIHRCVLLRLIRQQSKMISINNLYTLMEHGMELNSTEIFLEKVKKVSLMDMAEP